MIISMLLAMAKLDQGQLKGEHDQTTIDKVYAMLYYMQKSCKYYSMTWYSVAGVD